MEFADWSSEPVLFLKNEIAKGELTARKVALELTRKYNRPYSRNCVLGKAFRLGLSFRKGLPETPEEIATRREKHRLAILKLRGGAPKTGVVRMSPRRIALPLAPAPDVADFSRSRKFAAFEGKQGTWIQLEGSKPISLADMEYYHCRWPIGDPSKIDEFRFCGNKKDEDEKYSLPYCKHHSKIAFVPPKRG